MIFVTRSEEIKRRAADYILSLTSVQEIVIDDEKKSGQQEKFFHSLCTLIGKQTGNDKDYIKTALKIKVLPLHEVKIGDQSYMVPKSTTRLTKPEYSQLIEAAMILGQSLQLQMPLARLQGIE